jgi:hypothetical protein
MGVLNVQMCKMNTINYENENTEKVEIEVKNQRVFMRIEDIIHFIKNNPNEKYYKFINNEKILISNDIVINTLFICHRINSTNELLMISNIFGIEVDLRDNKEGIFLHHDPFNIGESFELFLLNYKHNFIILNIKTEGIEKRCVEIMKKYNIDNYIFLDSSIPVIYKCKDCLKEKMSCRFSEIEPIELYQKMQNMISWIWVDCFSIMPLNQETYNIFVKDNKKLCIVSPELQNQKDKIQYYREYLIQNKITPNAICCKLQNIYEWI